jgi:acrylyl-CoA reductase (NADPH)
MAFKALVVNQEGENFTREIKEIEQSFLKHGNVLVKVEYSSLNYKDGMILKNGGKLVKDFPHIPGIDFAGTVESSESDKFKKGDRVILTGWRVGEVFFGGYSQYAKVQDDFLVKMPDDLDSKKAMILGTAGLTALMCVLAIQARETILLGEPVKDVLVTGATGGVGSVAVLALSKLGYNVSAVTGKKDKADFLKSLGAKTIVDRSEMDQDARPIDKGLYDGVVDTTGGKILAKALSHTKPNGIVAACGLASSIKLETTVMPFIIRGVKLWGIDSVTAPAKRREFLWSQANNYIDFNLLSDGVQEWSLDDLIQNSSKILKGEISGRVIVDVNK